MTAEATDDAYQLSFVPAAADTLQIRLAGSWQTHHSLPASAELESQLNSHSDVQQITFDTSGMTGWDSALLTFLVRLTDIAGQKRISVDQSGLPEGVQRLLHLAAAVPERKGARRETTKVSLLARVGSQATSAAGSLVKALTFLADATLSLGRLFVGKAQFRFSDLSLMIQQTGAQALAIVALISFLVGLILAYIGAAQLAQFGRDVRRRSGRNRDGPRHGRHDDRHHHGGPHRRGLRRTARYHAGQRRGRRPGNTGYLFHGLPRSAPHAGADSDDAPAVSVLRFIWHPGRVVRLGNHV